MYFIDPVLLRLGPIRIYWYSLAYVFGVLLGHIQINQLAARYKLDLTHKNTDKLINYIIVGIVLGGRLGEVLLYDASHYWQHPLAIIKIWEGGMSFHGGALGVLLAIFIFAKRYHLHFWVLADLVASAAPIGLFLGRIGNFINQELCGRPTTMPWGIVFPKPWGNAMPDNIARHPSQLYEAFGEGILLWCILLYCFHKYHKCEGATTRIALISYGLIRFFLEYFRQPQDFFFFLTEGQALCALMIIIGVFLRPARKHSLT